MNRAQTGLAALVLSLCGIWGCTQGPAPAAAEKLRALEAKSVRLEEDYRSASAARDQFRRKLAASEEQAAVLQQEVARLQQVVKERDSLKQLVAVRTSERDYLQGQFEQFRKSIKELLGQTEAALAAPELLPAVPPAAVRMPAPTPSQS